MTKKLIFIVFVFSLWVAGTALAQQTPQIPLAGSAIPKFVQPLPLPQIGGPIGTGIYTTTGNTSMTITMCEFWANVLPPGTLAPGVRPKTRAWGYIVGTTCPANGPNDPALDTYTGPVIVNQRGSSTDITFVNNLGNAADTQVLAWKYSTDQTLHWADPMNDEANNCNETGGIPVFGSPCSQTYSGPIPAVVHIHGGDVPPELDGGPDAWFTSDGLSRGHGYYSFGGAPANGAIYKYPNRQEAAPIWFHDHVLGITRLNVYAGLAGGYYIEDPGIIPATVNTTAGVPGTCTANCLPENLQPLAEVVPLVIQDRMFDTNGQLFFPSDTAANILWTPNPEHPYWVPEFVGDTIVVNGKAWPFLNLEAKRYRFLLINGSNARTYELSLPHPVTGVLVPMYVIGTDGGYLDTPAPVNKLVIMPGERYEVIIDFAGAANTNLVMKNTGRTPFPKGAPPQGATLGKIIQFRVGTAPAVADASYNPAAIPVVPLRTGAQVIKRLPGAPGGPAILTAAGATQNVQKTRQLTLNEVMGMPQVAPNPVVEDPNNPGFGLPTAYPGGPLEVLVNNTKWGGTMGGTTRPDFVPVTVGTNTTYYSEIPREGDTEVWEIVNLTADAHPIHLHLVQFQIINRQNFNASKYTGVYNAAFPGGLFIGGYGPPLNYNSGNARALGGNPDITPYLQGPVQLPLLQERGWKDTVVMYPGQVTRLAVRWAPTDLALQTTPNLASLYYPFDPSGGNFNHGYVWHCHIIDHEDNEMMRPNLVELNPSAPVPASRPLVKGDHY